jgi:uncharacterized protein (DUF1778 family)
MKKLTPPTNLKILVTINDRQLKIIDDAAKMKYGKTKKRSDFMVYASLDAAQKLGATI